MFDFAQARQTMIDCQLRTFDVTDRAVLAAMDGVSRERFMPAGMAELAYAGQNIVLWSERDETRVMLQPMVLGRLVQALEIAAGDRVLDVAAGHGYASAVIGRLGASVVALESDAAAGARLEDHLAGEGITCRTGPLDRGCAADAPFDAILVNGALETRPEELLGQLKPGGRLACLLSADGADRAVLHVRSGDGSGTRRLFDASAPTLAAFRRVPAFAF